MKKHLMIIAAGLLFFASCSSYLDVTPPNAITDEQIMDLLKTGTDAQIDLVLGGTANGLTKRFNWGTGGGSETRYTTAQGTHTVRCLEANDVSMGTSSAGGFGADEYQFAIDIRSFGASVNINYWNAGWDNIRAANILLNLLPDDVVGNNPKLLTYKAWGLALRAYSYNWLMENYQDAYLNGGKGKLGLPLYDVFLPTQAPKARASAEDTYTFILTDAQGAVDRLIQAGVGTTDANTEDIDLAVAYFVLARAALCHGDWATVISACDYIIANKPLMGESIYGSRPDADGKCLADQNAFLNAAIMTECVLGWTGGNATYVRTDWFNPFGNKQGAGTSGFLRIDDRLYNQIDANDYRKDAFQGSAAFGPYVNSTGTTITVPSYVSFKFAASIGLGASDNKSPNVSSDILFRASEAYLMKAEAQLNSGNESGAKTTLNTLLAARTKSGAALLTCDNYSSMTAMSTLQKIQLQTRIEMWGESGLEFYNNKRWNFPVNRTGSTCHTSLSSYPVSGMTMEIVESEMLYNPNAVQN